MRSGDDGQPGRRVRAGAADRRAGDSRRGRVAGEFVGGEPRGVVFGPSMTTLTFAFSAAVGRTLGPGDEIVCTRLDHDANVRPWVDRRRARRRDRALRGAGPGHARAARRARSRPLLGERTRWVAVTRREQLRRVGARAPGRSCAAARQAGRACTSTPCTPRRTARSTPRASAATRSSAPPTSGSARTSRSSGLDQSSSRSSSPTSSGSPPTRCHGAGRPARRRSRGSPGVIAAVRYMQETGYDAIRAHEEALFKRDARRP